MLVVAALGPLGATHPAGRVPLALASPDAQTAAGEVTAGSAAEVSGTEGDGLRVRAEPSLDGTLRAVLVDGAAVQVLEGPVRADGLNWVRVSYDTQGSTGWVATRFLVARQPAGAVAAAAPPTVPSGSASAGTTSAAGPAAASTPASLALPSAPVLGGPAAPATVVVPASLAGGDPAVDPSAAGLGAPPAAPGLGTVPDAGPPSALAGGTITTTPGRYVRLGAYPAASPEYGMNVFIWGEANTTQRDIDRLRELGFGWQKTLFQWREIEGQGKGQFDWREADRVVAATSGAGIKILARIDFPPAWAVAPGMATNGNEAPPARFEDYADFIRAFTTRYGSGSPIGRVHAIEVWNEPNLAREWGNLPVNQTQAGDYVRLLKSAYEAAKSVDPQMTIITAGLTPTGTDNDDARPDDVYLQWIYDAGGAAYFDVLGAHGAGYRAPPNMSPDEVAADRSYGGHASFSFRRVEQLRDVMVRNGDDAKQVWLLEFGWTSDDVHPAYAWHRVTEDQKAEYIVGAYRWANQNWTPWIGVMCLWNLAAPGWTTTSEEYFWSITNPDGSPRAAYNRLRDARLSGELP
jgi:polysaccharide biosynthesis protein PslG